MKRYYIILLITIGVFVLLGLVLHPHPYRWARAHVNYLTAAEDHPLNCLSCHLYNQKHGFISKLVNADYYSPFNLALSQNGTKLYVVAEERNTLLIADTENRKVLHKIMVGNHPHSVILDNAEIGRAHV